MFEMLRVGGWLAIANEESKNYNTIKITFLPHINNTILIFSELKKK